MKYLKQSTASQTITIGPFIDDTDFKTTENGLTIANTDIKLKKNGATAVNKNSGGGTNDVNGMVAITLDATDTNTVGELNISVKVAGALVVVKDCEVLEEAVYDLKYGASATGEVPLQNDAITAAKIAANAIGSSEIADGALTAAKIATDAIGDTEISAAMANKIADHIWRRTVANVEASSNGDTIGTSRGAYVVLAKHNNKCGVSGGTLTVYQDDDTTSVITQSVTSDAAADPITVLDTV